LRKQIRKTRTDKAELKPIYDCYEFQSLVDLEAELKNVMNSNEYLDNYQD